jgi:hypothetical protein
MWPEQAARAVQAIGTGVAIAVAVMHVVVLAPAIASTWGPVVGVIVAAVTAGVAVEAFVRWRRRRV